MRTGDSQNLSKLQSLGRAEEPGHVDPHLTNQKVATGRSSLAVESIRWGKTDCGESLEVCRDELQSQEVASRCFLGRLMSQLEFSPGSPGLFDSEAGVLSAFHSLSVSPCSSSSSREAGHDTGMSRKAALQLAKSTRVPTPNPYKHFLSLPSEPERPALKFQLCDLGQVQELL